MYLSNFCKRILFWIKCARYQSYAQSLLPAALAFAVVVTKRDYALSMGDILLGVFAIFGVVLAHSSANLFDDYFDYSSKAVQKRREMIDGGIRARSMKCVYLDSGMATTRELLLVSVIMGALGTLFGGIILVYRGLPIFVCFLIGVVLAFFYSAPPLRLSYRGFGEFVVGLLFGPVLMSGVSYAVCGRLDSSVSFLSIPMGILAANILYVHSIMDLDPDKRAGKYTLAALMGSKRTATLFCGFLLFACYAVVIAGVFCKYLPPATLIVLLSFPIAFALFKAMWIYLNNPDQKIERKAFYGPMECWDMICKAKIDWFMVRWYLARNLLTAFAVCAFLSILVNNFV